MLNNKILLFADWYEPGYKAGGPIQSCKNLARILRDKHAVYIFTSDRDLGDEQPYRSIRFDEWIEKEDRIYVWYASPAFLNNRNVGDLIDELQPDIVYFNSMYSWPFTLLPLRVLVKKKFRGRIILAPRGMLHKGALQKKFLKKYLFLKLFRYLGWHKKVIFHATDDQEQQDIYRFFGSNARIIVAKDTPYFPALAWRTVEKKAGWLDCVFISRIHPKKNLHFLLERLAEINPTIQLRFDIYGTEDDRVYADSCKSLAARLKPNIQVQFRGPLAYELVPETVQRYHLFVLPTLGENFGHAIFEALSAGRPVLISDQTPWRDLEKKRTGWDFPLNQPRLFTDTLEQVAAFDQETYNEWSLGAWTYADTYAKQSDLAKEYDLLFNA